MTRKDLNLPTRSEPPKTPGEQGGDEKPLYVQIVDTLKREIVDGEFPVGTALPSEAALVSRFAVSRHTVREALRTMRESGLVTSHQGLGTVVKRAADCFNYVHQINTISDLFPVNVETYYELVPGGLVTLPQLMDMVPELGPGHQWLRIRGSRTRPGQDTPFNELEVFVAAQFASVGSMIGVQSGPIYGMIEALCGESIGDVEQIFGAFECDGEIGLSLGMEKGDIGIEVRRIFRLAQSEDIAMISFNRYLPSAFSFSMSLRKVRA